ncbi:uncharacterized protein LOC144880477 [Branchiostoma floridae x Branchiostoma japonicum]
MFWIHGGGFTGGSSDVYRGEACDIPKQDVSITTTPSDPGDIYISANVTFHCKTHHVDVVYLSVIFPNKAEKVGFGVNEIDFVVPNIQPANSGPYTCQVRDTRGNTLNTTFVLKVTNCAPDTKGARCDEVCGCLQGASCDRWAGCVCPPGWTGTRCQTKCPQGTYGQDCARNCSCQNGATCDKNDGRCECEAGWYGMDCSKPCNNGRFGWRCQQICTCKNNATCSNVDGSCACVTPLTGPDCGQWQASRDEPLLESLARDVRCNRPGVDELLPLKWMALESIETGEYTCQSDVWSFGVLLWEIATLGKDPCYDGRMQLSFLQMVGILRQGIRLEKPPGCPEDLYRLMRSCWRDVPDTRPTPEGIEERLLQLREALLPHDVIEMENVV